MEIDPVDSMAESVVRPQFGKVAIREARKLLDFLVARDGAKRDTMLGGPRSFPRDRIAQDDVTGEGVEARCRLGLIPDLVRAVAVDGRREDVGRKGLVHADLLFRSRSVGARATCIAFVNVRPVRAARYVVVRDSATTDHV
jgi:hypothetical protein